MNNTYRQSSRPVTAALTAVCVLGLVGCGAPVGGSATHSDTAAAAEAAGAALEMLLLDDGDIARIVDAPLATVETYSAVPGPDGRTYSDLFCGGAISSASTATYDPGDVRDVRGRRLSDGDTSFSRSVDQSVLAFPDAHAAGEFVASARTGWTTCAGTTVETRDDDGDSARWQVAPPRFDGAVLSLTGHHLSGWASEHAISAQGAIVIDVAVSSADAVPDRAVSIVRSIAARLSQ